MTEGDIYTLEWSEVDRAANCIRRDRRKTGADIVLPLLPQLTYLNATVSGVSADNITLIFGDDGSLRYDELATIGCFDDAASEKIFEDKNKGMLA